MEDNFLKVLIDKEKQLQRELEGNPVFKQLETVRHTISMFANVTPSNMSTPNKSTSIPTSDSWGKRILFVINKLGKPYISEIIEELKKLGATEDNIWLQKRVSVMVNHLKSGGSIDVEMDGKRGKYYINI
jgi:hypothetical protein